MRRLTSAMLLIALMASTTAADPFAWAERERVPPSRLWAQTLRQPLRTIEAGRLRAVLAANSVSEALATANDLIAANPLDPTGLALRALVHRRGKNWSACVADGAEAVARGVGAVQAACLARSCTTQACWRDPNLERQLLAATNGTARAEAWMRLGELWLELDQPTRAITALARASALQARAVDVRVALALAYDIVGDDAMLQRYLAASGTDDWYFVAAEPSALRAVPIPRGLVGLSERTQLHATAIRGTMFAPDDATTSAAWRAVAAGAVSDTVRVRAERHARTADDLRRTRAHASQSASKTRHASAP